MAEEKPKEEETWEEHIKKSASPWTDSVNGGEAVVWRTDEKENPIAEVFKNPIPGQAIDTYIVTHKIVSSEPIRELVPGTFESAKKYIDGLLRAGGWRLFEK